MKRTLILFVLIFGVALYADNYRRSHQIRLQFAKMSLSEKGPAKNDRNFMPGQTVWIILKVHGLQKDTNKDIGFQSDLVLKGKDGRIVLNKKNILNQKLHAGDITPVVTATYHIDLYSNIKAERYKVNITFRDTVAVKYNVYNTWFKVVR